MTNRKDKTSLRQVILKVLEEELLAASRAADSARETATSKETIAENKYDTFGLEASYLAHGQSKRAAELLQAIDCYKSLSFTAFTDSSDISLTAVVALESAHGEIKTLFIGPCAGGLQVSWQEMDLMVITLQTPLGCQLLGKQLDDIAELVINNQCIKYKIVGVS